MNQVLKSCFAITGDCCCCCFPMPLVMKWKNPLMTFDWPCLIRHRRKRGGNSSNLPNICVISAQHKELFWGQKCWTNRPNGLLVGWVEKASHTSTEQHLWIPAQHHNMAPWNANDAPLTHVHTAAPWFRILQLIKWKHANSTLASISRPGDLCRVKLNTNNKTINSRYTSETALIFISTTSITPVMANIPVWVG